MVRGDQEDPCSKEDPSHKDRSRQIADPTFSTGQLCGRITQLSFSGQGHEREEDRMPV